MKRKLTPKNLFLLICFAELAAFAVYAFMTGEEAWRWFTFKGGLDTLGTDYFRHVIFSASGSQLYEVSRYGGFFPPFSYMLYYFFYRVSAMDGAVPVSWLAADNGGAYLYVYIVFVIVSVLVVYLAVESFLHRRMHKSVFACIMASGAFLGSGLIVGNTIFLVLAMMLLALDWKDSDSKVKRELALIFIAMSAGLKIYPAIFGFLYVKERRWKETFRLILYGMIVAFVPFVFFGGVQGFITWFKHITAAMYFIEFARIQYIRGVAVYIMTLITGNIDSRLVNRVALYAPTVFLVLMFAFGMLSRNKIRPIYFFTAAMVFFPTNAYRYSLGLFAIPMLFWFRDEAENSTTDNWITSLLYAGIFGIPMLFGVCSGFGGVLEYETLSYVEFWLYGCAYTLLVYECAVEVKALLSRNKDPR